jgi:hypothetical protein
MAKTIYEYKILVGNHEGKRPLGRPRRRRNNNNIIIIFLKERKSEEMGWIQVAQDSDQRLGSSEHNNDLLASAKSEEYLEHVSDC